jgi:hypothetical protein
MDSSWEFPYLYQEDILDTEDCVRKNQLAVHVAKDNLLPEDRIAPRTILSSMKRLQEYEQDHSTEQTRISPLGERALPPMGPEKLFQLVTKNRKPLLQGNS